MTKPAHAAPIEKTRKFIKLRDVKALSTLSTSELYRRIADGRFPKQIALGPKSSAWIEAGVIASCDARIAECRKVAA